MLEAEDVDEAETSATPVPRRRAMGRSGGAELGSVELISGALPSTARRARSCLVCTVRKWARSSGHLISSRASFDLVATVTTVLLQLHQCLSSARLMKVERHTVWVLCAGIRQN